MFKVIINPEKKKLGINFKEIIQYRDLFWVLTNRDLKVRYAQTALGFVWALIQPALTLSIFILIFSGVAKVDTGKVPYPVFALSGMVVWTYCANLLSNAGSSVLVAGAMVKKIYFPRLILPLYKGIVGLVDLAIVLLLLILVMAYYGFVPGKEIIFFPLFLLMAMVAGLSLGIWASALSIRYRDIQIIIPFVVQFGTWATPIAYPASMIPQSVKAFYYINPMVGIVEGFRWSITGINPPGPYSYISFAVVTILFFTGFFYFRKVEAVMADLL